MPRIGYRMFATRGVYASIPAFRDEIHKAMNNEVAQLVVSDLNDIATSLNLDMSFSTGSVVTSDGITLNVVPVGRGTKIWRWVSYGTKAHWISAGPRQTHRGYKGYKPALSLARYSPKTSPYIRGSYGGPGQYTTNLVYRQRVRHPGIKPRYFERSVAYNVRKDYYNIMENALRRAVRRAQREGKQ
jgi:hypothetical protein